MAGPLALVAANAYVFFFGMSWGPAVWVLLGEIFPNRLRAAALGLAAAMQWLANFAISATFPSLAGLGLFYAYGIYALAALVSVVFVVRFIRETRGRELESIDETYAGLGASPQRVQSKLPPTPNPTPRAQLERWRAKPVITDLNDPLARLANGGR